MEKLKFIPVILEETIIEGYHPGTDEPVYWKYIRGEVISQEILDQDPVYRLMRKTPKGENNAVN